MNKRVFIIHGWNGSPQEGWFPWLKEELEIRGFSVSAPLMPEADEPHIASWVRALHEAVGIADQQTYFVGHSIACSAIVRYLETLPVGVQVGGAVFVAGFFKKLANITNEEMSKELRDEWLKTPVDFMKVASHLKRSISIFSDGDHYVPPENQAEFRDELRSKMIIERGMGHFSGSQGVFKLPVALNAVLELTI